MSKTLCPVCKTNPVRAKDEACYDCSMTALAAYGWTNGEVDSRGMLKRGPADPVARKKLDELVEQRKKNST